MDNKSLLAGLDRSRLRNLLAFRLGQQTYALPIEPLVQIIPMLTITPVPQLGEMMEGMINVHGMAVPVVNMRRHLDLPAAPLQLHTPILLIRIGEPTVGLIVDQVVDVINLPAAKITPPSDILPEGATGAPLLQGLAHTPDGIMLLLDPAYLFLPDQVQALIQATDLLAEILKETVGDEPSVVKGANAEVRA
jgi:purine-binding chemotaxis protein CheW